MITRDPKVLGGKPVIQGTRLSVSVVLGHLGSGWTKEELAENYRVSVGDIDDALQYAAHWMDQATRINEVIRRSANRSELTADEAEAIAVEEVRKYRGGE